MSLTVSELRWCVRSAEGRLAIEGGDVHGHRLALGARSATVRRRGESAVVDCSMPMGTAAATPAYFTNHHWSYSRIGQGWKVL
ncbi:hypothetical protein [Streptomyces caeruleatus]|uniref:hypothetical protein n=1 Tax=Streptomyces caeruleatus TaxID=661399 RepID=UPI000B08ADA5|nr:hypothetical protein [Streptomyces caeruleatus]